MALLLLPLEACSAGWHRIEPVAPSSLVEGQQSIGLTLGTWLTVGFLAYRMEGKD